MSPPSRSEDIWKTSSVGDNKLTATKSVADSTCRIHVPPRTGEQQCLSMRLRPKKLQSSSGLDEGGFVFIESFPILISLALEWGDLARPADLGLFPSTQVAVSQTFIQRGLSIHAVTGTIWKPSQRALPTSVPCWNHPPTPPTAFDLPPTRLGPARRSPAALPQDGSPAHRVSLALSQLRSDLLPAALWQ